MHKLANWIPSEQQSQKRTQQNSFQKSEWWCSFRNAYDICLRSNSSRSWPLYLLDSSMHVGFHWITRTWNAFLQVRWCPLGKRILFHKFILRRGITSGLIFPPIATFHLGYCHLDLDCQQRTSLGWSLAIKPKQRILLDSSMHSDSLPRNRPYFWIKGAPSLP